MSEDYPYPYPNTWWNPHTFEQKRPYLEKRIHVIKAVRNHFDNQGFYEVETPALQVSPGMEPHLMAFETTQYSPNRQNSIKAYLHTSPEFTMKKLIVAGVEKQYQICKVFRNANGRVIGLDIQINDAKEGQRQSLTTWNDLKGIAYMDTSVFGNLKLEGKN